MRLKYYILLYVIGTNKVKVNGPARGSSPNLICIENISKNMKLFEKRSRSVLITLQNEVFLLVS